MIATYVLARWTDGSFTLTGWGWLTLLTLTVLIVDRERFGGKA